MIQSTDTITQTRWSLADLIASPDGPALEDLFKQLDSSVTDFEAVRSSLSNEISPEAFLSIVRRLEDLYHSANILNSYAGLWLTEDTQNQASQSLVARVDQFMAEMSNRVLFFELWWKALDDDQANRLMAGSGDYLYWLEERRHFKPHTLSEAEEKIINIKNVTGANAFGLLSRYSGSSSGLF